MAIKQEIFRQTVAHIQLDFLAHNFRLLQTLNGKDKFLCPMVKANAYGHGDIEVALRLEKEGCKSLGVGLVEEGLLLRQNGVRCEILVYGIFDNTAAEQLVKWRLTPVISTWEQIQALETIRHTDQTHKLAVHLKFDTGMHRLGFSLNDGQKLFEKLSQHPRLQVTGICTHLSSGEDADKPTGKSFIQLERFAQIENIFSSLQPVRHGLNSAGLLNFWNSELIHGHYSQNFRKLGARPGLLLYGILPPGVSNTRLEQEGLQFKPVMSLRSNVVRFLQISANETVSYGGTWQAKRPSILGVIPIGYADGYHRNLSNQAHVLVKGRLVPQVGNVCMDFIIVDLTGVVSIQEVHHHMPIEVCLFGFDTNGNLLNPSELAAKSNTIPWEILTSVGERVPRIFTPEVTI
jgi:alanine racemase